MQASIVAPALPLEIIQQILHYVSSTDQKTFHSASLISRSWNRATTERLYERPILIGKNFDAFVQSVCPSINAHVRQNGLADLVRRLDMSGLVHSGSKSLTARLLGRMKHNLVHLIAPQASFGISSLAAISKCNRMQYLDLGFVSEAIPLSDLLRSISKLDKLQVLHLPRASTSTMVDRAAFCDIWPPNLKVLHANGGFNEQNEGRLNNLPSSVTHLWIENCPRPTRKLVQSFFTAKGAQFTFLRVGLRSRRVFLGNFASCIGSRCQNLLHLSINLETLSDAFEDAEDPALKFATFEQLDIDCLEEHDDEELQWCLTQMSYLLFSEKMPRLRKLSIHRNLRWTASKAMSIQVDEINDLLKALAREDTAGNIPEGSAGVFLHGQQ